MMTFKVSAKVALAAAAMVGIASQSASAAAFYWDNNGTTAGFGNAGGTWAQNSTSGGTSARWKTDSGGTASGSAGQITNNSPVHTFNFGTTTNALGTGTITVSGSVQMGDTTYASSSGTITLSGGQINFGDSAGGNKTITVNNSANVINSVLGDYSPASTTLTKAGTGKLTLGGTNTFSGQFIVNAGTLAISAAGSIDSTSGVKLGGGTFDVALKGSGYAVNNLTGSGSVLGSLTVNTLLSPGTSPGTINFADLTLGSASTYTHEVTGGSNTADLGNVSGTLTISGGATLSLNQLGTYTLGDKFTLFAYPTGTLSGVFAGLSDDSTFTAAGGDWLINYNDTSAGLNGGSGTSFVTVTAVPEPATLGLLATAGLFLGRRKRVIA